MPPPPASVGRPAAIARAPQPRDPDIEPGDGQEDAGQGGPDHHTLPERAVPAQHGRIEPVRNGAQPRPQPALPVGRLDHRSGPLGDVDHRLGRAGEGDAIDRPPARGAFDRPLVLFDQLGRRLGAGDSLAGGEVRRRGGRLGRSGRWGRGAGPEVEDAAAGRQSQHRPAGQHLEAEAADRRSAEVRHGAGAGEVERLESLEPLSGGHLRETAIQHDEARQTPERHHQPDRDAQIAMDEQDDPHRGGALRSLRPQRPSLRSRLVYGGPGRSPQCWASAAAAVRSIRAFQGSGPPLDRSA